MSDLEQAVLSALDLSGLAVTDEERVRAEFGQWCKTQLPSCGDHAVRFHSNYGGETNGLFTVWSELYEWDDLSVGEPLPDSGQVVAVDVAAGSDTAWQLCTRFGDALKVADPDSGAVR